SDDLLVRIDRTVTHRMLAAILVFHHAGACDANATGAPGLHPRREKDAVGELAATGRHRDRRPRDPLKVPGLPVSEADLDRAVESVPLDPVAPVVDGAARSPAHVILAYDPERRRQRDG